MAILNDNNQSPLEVQGIEARTEQAARSDYNKDDEYNERHPDALADGDGQGKGTGDFGGPSWSVPDFTKPKGQIDYSSFNSWEGGNDCDQQARTVMTARSIYGPNSQYGIDVKPDTSLNVSDGQYDGSQQSRIAYVCPVA